MNIFTELTIHITTVTYPNLVHFHKSGYAKHGCHTSLFSTFAWLFKALSHSIRLHHILNVDLLLPKSKHSQPLHPPVLCAVQLACVTSHIISENISDCGVYYSIWGVYYSGKIPPRAIMFDLRNSVSNHSSISHSPPRTWYLASFCCTDSKLKLMLFWIMGEPKNNSKLPKQD